LLCGSIGGALIAVLATAVGALVWFLKRLVDKTIPQQAERFERVMTSQLDEMKAQREQCAGEHKEHEKRADQRHAEVMEALSRRPFVPPGPPIKARS